MTKIRPLQMSISLSVLQHLGLNLYSNVPAVLSEIVANAWDADATVVTIDMDPKLGSIIVEDNGNGMTRDQVIDRFLTVGFDRRDQIGPLSENLNRDPMGRKGIGKLSIFSIAKVASVFTTRDGEQTAFRMDAQQIKTQIKQSGGGPYKPTSLSINAKHPSVGTRIILENLSKSITGLTTGALKKRVARRFSIIGPQNKFEVKVDGETIGPSDRGYHLMLEYLWTYGNQSELVDLSTRLETDSFDRSSNLNAILTSHGLKATGWIGTVRKPGQLFDDGSDNLNRVAIFMRGKLAQEDVLSSIGHKEIFADYIVGELHCDDLDEDAQDDVATSSRQSLKQDDPRYLGLITALKSELKYIATAWTDLRNSRASEVAKTVPAVNDWLENLTGDTKKKAERWIGRFNTIRADDDNDKKELLKASILAFESFRRREQLDSLDEIESDKMGALLPIFRDVDQLEISYYGQIVRMRLDVIRKLKEIMDADVLEKDLQKYIFEHLWLLDPSWERAEGTPTMETNVEKFLSDNTAALSKEQKKGRIDIGYRTTSSRHVIIELKRKSVATPIDKLTQQIRKYRNGTRKILNKGAHKDWPLDIICLVGKHPPEWHEPDGPKQVEEALAALDARLLFYDQIIDNAEEAYSEYLESHRAIDKLGGIFDSIDDFAPDVDK